MDSYKTFHIFTKFSVIEWPGLLNEKKSEKCDICFRYCTKACREIYYISQLVSGLSLVNLVGRILLYYMTVSHGLGTTKFMNLIG